MMREVVLSLLLKGQILPKFEELYITISSVHMMGLMMFLI